jgi:hypothetical protein
MAMSPDRYIPKGIREMDPDDPLYDYWMSKEYVDPRHMKLPADEWTPPGDKYLSRLRARDAKHSSGAKRTGMRAKPGTLSPERKAYIKEQAQLTERKRDRKWTGKGGISVDVPKGASGYWHPPADFQLAMMYEGKPGHMGTKGLPLNVKREQRRRKLAGDPMTKGEYQQAVADEWQKRSPMKWNSDPMRAAMDPIQNNVISDVVPKTVLMNRYMIDEKMNQLRLTSGKKVAFKGFDDWTDISRNAAEMAGRNRPPWER